MRILMTNLIIALLVSMSATGAEYQGHNIDGKPLPATLVELNKYRYKGTVTFKGKAATLHVRKAISVSVDEPKSKTVHLLLCHEKITNPYHIEVTNPGLECSHFPNHMVILELQIPTLDTTQWPK